jgi:osmoprotectant transport system substrate-binding protein
VERVRYFTAAVLAALLLVASAGCGGSEEAEESPKRPGSRPPVTIGTKNFPEQFVLGELYAQALRARGFRVELKKDIGATEIIHRALRRGTLDMYPEYIGVLVAEVARAGVPASAREAYLRAKSFEEDGGFTLLDRTPFANRDALAVKPAYARRHRLESIGDLERVGGKVKVGAPPEFRTRFEGFVGLREEYGLDNLDFTPIPIGDQYRALTSGRIDAADVFTTDGELEDSSLVILDDPENLFGFQNVAPVVSQRTLRAQGPRFARTINAVSALLTTEVMRSMNAAMLRGQDPEAVAARFLREQDLI